MVFPILTNGTERGPRLHPQGAESLTFVAQDCDSAYGVASPLPTTTSRQPFFGACSRPGLIPAIVTTGSGFATERLETATGQVKAGSS